MNKRMLPVGIMFIALGICFFIIFKNNTPGIIAATLFVAAGLVALIRGGTARS